MTDFFSLPPGVVAGVLVMLWPAIWAGALIIIALWSDVARHTKRQDPHRVRKAA